jgi:hypothetical protein
MTNSMMSRRRVLEAGVIGSFNLAVPGLISARVDANRSLGNGAAPKSCILVWLCGGPSHLDTWDLKPDAPEGIRGPYRPAASAVPGLRLNELHTRLAPLAKHIAVIRSMRHVGNISNHFDAMHHCLTGQAGAPNDAPYIGSVLSSVRPSRDNVASYFWLMNPGRASVFISAFIGTGGFLGARHAPMFIGNANNHPAMPNYRGAEDVFAPADPVRMADRNQLLAGIEANSSSETARIRVRQEWGDLHQRAFELANGPGGRQVFEMEREPAKVRDRYGRIRSVRTCSCRAALWKPAPVVSPSAVGWARPRMGATAPPASRAGTCTAATWAWATPSAPARTG